MARIGEGKDFQNPYADTTLDLIPDHPDTVKFDPSSDPAQSGKRDSSHADWPNPSVPPQGRAQRTPRRNAGIE